jgi:hypothetical protein
MENKKDNKNFFYRLVQKDNDLDEKSFVGLLSFVGLFITLIVDLIVGELKISEFVFDGFLILTLGSFGISQVNNFKKK